LFEYSVDGKKGGGHGIGFRVIRRQKGVILKFSARFCGKCTSPNKFELKLNLKKTKKAKHSFTLWVLGFESIPKQYFTTSAKMNSQDNIPCKLTQFCAYRVVQML